MKKRLLVFLAVAALLVLAAFSAMADGPNYWDSTTNTYQYYAPSYGIVICRQMTVRDRPSTNGASYGMIKNGQPVKILGKSQDGNFYMVDLASCGFQNAGDATVGYVKSSLIKIDPQFLASTKLTDIYATPWSTQLKIGEHVDRFWLVIDQNYNWYAVQAMESSVGAGFILSSDVGNYSGYQQKYLITWDNVPLLDEASWSQIQTLKRFSVGTFVQMGGNDYTLLVFNQGQPNEFRGWVSDQYIAPIIN